jgi:hypothetical protein
LPCMGSMVHTYIYNIIIADTSKHVTFVGCVCEIGQTLATMKPLDFHHQWLPMFVQWVDLGAGHTDLKEIHWWNSHMTSVDRSGWVFRCWRLQHLQAPSQCQHAFITSKKTQMRVIHVCSLQQGTTNYTKIYMIHRFHIEKTHPSHPQGPHLRRRDLMCDLAQLSDFDEQLYKVTKGSHGFLGAWINSWPEKRGWTYRNRYK